MNILTSVGVKQPPKQLHPLQLQLARYLHQNNVRPEGVRMLSWIPLIWLSRSRVVVRKPWDKERSE